MGIVLEIEDRIKPIEEKNRERLIKTNAIGFILSAIAGWINAVGINLFLSESPSFMSGKGLVLGSSFLSGDLKAFMSVSLVIISFIIGACFSTLVTSKKGLSAGLFLAGALIIISSIPYTLRNEVMDTIIISMAMGAQNAATSLTPLNRTTHLTGPATDIGISLAKGNWRRVGFWGLRWISFPIGAAIGFVLVEMFHKDIISLSLTLFLPGILIIVMGIIQDLFLHIPLLDEIN